MKTKDYQATSQFTSQMEQYEHSEQRHAGAGKALASAMSLALLGFAGPAMADVGDNFYSMDKKKGDRQVELIWESHNRRGSNLEGAGEIGFGYGVSDNWFTQISTEHDRESGDGIDFEGFSWQNIVKLSGLERSPVQVGFLAEITRFDRSIEGYQLKLGPLLQKDIGQVQVQANLLFQKQYGDLDTLPTELGYQLRAKYNLQPTLAVGLEGFGEMGQWDDWAPRSEQSHRFGPAVFGKYSLGGQQELQYSASYLSDFSDRASSHGFRFSVDYKF